MQATNISRIKALWSQPASLWITLFLISGIPRILGAFLLPNAFGDAYSYIEFIKSMNSKLVEGTFAMTDLFGFWLPLYQFICALISVFVGQPFYVAKVVSAVTGIGVCILVFSITLRLTGHRVISFLSFVLIALSPQHILYSSSALTDVPHAFFILGSLYFTVRKNWILAASFAAVAGLIRIESWMFIALLPALQFLNQGRVSLIACGILVIPPLFWFYICWKATGNFFAYFEIRNNYIRQFVAANPKLARLSSDRIIADGRTLINSTNPAVMIGCLIGACVIIRRLILRTEQHNSENLFPAIATALYFFASLGFLLFAYLTGNQPDMWYRYGLILFALGIPLLSWTFLAITKRNPYWMRLLAIPVMVVCFWQTQSQLIDAVGLVNQVSVQRVIANSLRDRYQANPDSRIFCEDGTVRALSGIPPGNFLTSDGAPRNPEQFLIYLKDNKVEYLVYIKMEISVPAMLFPELNDGAGNHLFQPVMHASSKHWPTDIWLYRLNN